MAIEIGFVTRAEWGALPPDHVFFIGIPTKELWLHHSVSSGTDESAVRAIQAFHMADPPAGRGWSDIAYSFLIDNDQGDIDIFVGRGAGVAGGHTKDHNTISHAICIIGNFTTTPPGPETLEATAKLVAYGYQEGWWPLGFTGGHRDALVDGEPPGTACPGDALYALIPSINARAIEIYEESLMPTVEEIHAYLQANPITVKKVSDPVDIQKPGTGAFLRQNLLLDPMPGTAGSGSVKERLIALASDSNSIEETLASMSAWTVTVSTRLNDIVADIAEVLAAVQAIDTDPGDPDPTDPALVAKLDEALAHLVAIREGLGSAGF